MGISSKQYKFNKAIWSKDKDLNIGNSYIVRLKLFFNKGSYR